MVLSFKHFNKNQHVCLASRKDLVVGGWGLENPYGVRILNPLEIIGRSLNSSECGVVFFRLEQHWTNAKFKWVTAQAILNGRYY